MPYHTGGKKAMDTKPPSGGNSEKNTPLKMKAPKKGKGSKPSKKDMKPKNSKTKTPSKQKMNIISKSGLHHSQKKRMMDHAVHHTAKHLNYMIGKMDRGSTFSQSHRDAMMEVGK